MSSTPGQYRPITLADAQPLVSCLADDPDVIASALHDEISRRHSLMIKMGFAPWPGALAERSEWYAALAAVRPWHPARFTLKIREMITVCDSLGSSGSHVRAGCVRAARRALPWRIDDRDEEWRDAEAARLIAGE